MGANTDKEFTVRFEPEGAALTVPGGTTVLQACRLADIPLDAVCGGEGKCGRCKVIVKGRHSASPTSLVSADEATAGVVLACTTMIEGDATVEILPRARIGRHQILTKAVDEIPKPISPWVSKEYLELPPPSLSDNLADLERLMRGLKRKKFCMPLETLSMLPRAMRTGAWKVTSTVSELELINEVSRVEPGDTTGRLLGIAVDVGTTTVVIDLVDLVTGKTIATASDYNRQTSRGEDVIARMMYSEDKGVSELKLLVRQTINMLVSRLASDAVRLIGRQVSKEDIVAASIAGNTVMTHFLVGLDTRNIRLEPYVPAAYHMPCLKAQELALEIDPAARVLLFPSRAGYVGGDVVADVLASGLHREKGPAMLIDVGTNGEIVLGGKDWLASCSCSAGPAFEGGEVSSGMRAMDGAIDKIRINEDFSTSYHVLGDTEPAGICGSGLIDLIAEMYARGVIDRKARIQDVGNDRVRQSDSGMEYIVERKARMGQYATRDLTVTDADLQNLVRTKAAVYGACSVLLRKTGEAFENLQKVFVAGGFGYHLDVVRAISIGMFPDLPMDKYSFIGNGSLGGAKLALISAKRRREVNEIFSKMTYLELSVDDEFYEEFSSAMFIPHTELDRFPNALKGPGGRDER